MSARRAGVVGLALLAAACGGSETSPGKPAPGQQRAGDFVDLDPAPDRVAVHLIAAPAEVEILEGKSTPVWAYRDGAQPEAPATVPGPLLDVRQGQHVEIRFDNQLPVETTIHWHGIRLDASMDGSNISQMPVPPGESFTYSFVARDAGFFWYHPHLAADEQIEAGLQAPLVVRGGTEPDVSAERFFVLDDIKVESTGERSEVITQLDLMVGRQGNVLLVNGQRNAEIEMAEGGRERWRFVNSANGHFFNLTLGGASMRVVGWDGGEVDVPYQVETLLISPGERYDIIVETTAASGEALVLRDAYYDRGHNLPDNGPKDLLKVNMGPAVAAPLQPLPLEWGSTPRIDVDGVASRQLALTEVMDDADPAAEPVFFINGERWPDVTPTMVDYGTTEIWEVVNDAEMDHPFHLHGMFFQILDIDGALPEALAWKDTVMVPRQKTARLAVTYDAPGEWMFHCHILEHAERGMMGHLHVME
ncbi:MAG: multicopper oxidase family protein [Polyangiaceae bacterium]